MSYSEREVVEATVSFFKGDDLASQVWMDKYALKNREGEFLEKSPYDMFSRISTEVARVDKKYLKVPYSESEIFELFYNKYFTYAGSCLFGIGNDNNLTSLGNCFVIGNGEDSYAGILQTDAEQIQLMKRRGGVGHDISHLRSKNSFVNNAARTSTGAVSFMNRFSNSTTEVAQGGRRGALMLTMGVTHSDIEDFIESKNDLTKVTSANISVKVDDTFMEKVEEKDPNTLHIWNKIIHQAWKNAEPGVLFWDRIKEESPADCYAEFQTISTNPCGEVPLSAYDSCRLGSLIVSNFVINPFTKDSYFDFDLLGRKAYMAQYMMDDLIDLEEEKINLILNKLNSEPQINNIEVDLWTKIKTNLLNGRRTGLGFLGLADVFAMLGIKYDVKEAIYLGEEIAKTIACSSYRASIQMAKERGAFPVWNKELEEKNPFINRILLECPDLKKDYEKYGRRNISNLSIAPTGSLAILNQTSSGIEPVFNLSYIRRKRVSADDPKKTVKDDNGEWWQEYTVFHPKFKEWNEINAKLIGIDISQKEYEALVEHVVNNPYYGSTTNEINPLQKIRMQGKIQKWVDHSISVTHNLPKVVTEEEVSEFYFEAWLNGCKGVTIYREGSRSGVLINKEDNTKEIIFTHNEGYKRPKDVNCDIYSTKIRGEQFIVVIGLIDDKPYEVFAFQFNGKFDLRKGIIRKFKKSRYDILTESLETYSENITVEMTQSEEDRTRMISTALRHGVNIKFIVEQLNKSKSDITSFSKAIARVLNKYVIDEVRVNSICPKCKSILSYSSGCEICLHCGYSACS